MPTAQVLTTQPQATPPISMLLHHHHRRRQEQRAATDLHHTHSELASPSADQASGVKDLLPLQADQALGAGEAEAVVEAATIAAARTANTTSTSIHLPVHLLLTESTLKARHAKDLHMAQDAMDITDTESMAHEALDIMAEDEEDGVGGVDAEDTEGRLQLAGLADSI